MAIKTHYDPLYRILQGINRINPQNSPAILNIRGSGGIPHQIFHSVPQFHAKKPTNKTNENSRSQGPFRTEDGQLELQIEGIHIHNVRQDHLPVLPICGDKRYKLAKLI